MTPRRFARGLVVGKFAPLHHGHELLIGRALAECDEVVVLSYCDPELPGCGPERRERWLRDRFPQARRLVLRRDSLPAGWAGGGPDEFTIPPPNDAPHAVHRRFTALVCLKLLGVEVDAVFTSEAYGEGFAAALTDEFRRHRPGAAGVHHVAVDPARQLVPASGTAIRADPHAHRDRLAPDVYASFVRRVCLLGGESSGKSTLAAALARALDTVYVPEYGRERWEACGGDLAFPDMLRIAQRQVEREDAAVGRAHGWLVCDTSPLTTLFYSHDLFGRTDPVLERLAAERRYDLTLLCAPDFPFVQDGTRRDDAFRRRQHAWYLAQLTARRDPWTHVEGDVDRRARTALAHVRAIAEA